LVNIWPSYCRNKKDAVFHGSQHNVMFVFGADDQADDLDVICGQMLTINV